MIRRKYAGRKIDHKNITDIILFEKMVSKGRKVKRRKREGGMGEEGNY